MLPPPSSTSTLTYGVTSSNSAVGSNAHFAAMMNKSINNSNDSSSKSSARAPLPPTPYPSMDPNRMGTKL
jgi:hypothetical protein